MPRTALILGPSGRFGRHMAAALAENGWTIRPYDRKTGNLLEAAKCVGLIVHGWNPPYDRWDAEVMDLTADIIAAARLSGATVLVPGNIYVFGARSAARLDENSPHRAENALGRIRREMEQALRDSGVRMILLRAGDFLDPLPSGNWFDRVIAAKLDKGVLTYPGNPDIPHAWAYLPDYARAFALLAEQQEDLPRQVEFTFGGYTLSGQQMADMLGVRLKRMNWLPIILSRPVWKIARHLLEMRYLWDMPHRLDGTRLAGVLPEFAPTPAPEALHAAVSFKIDPDKMVVGGPLLA